MSQEHQDPREQGAAGNPQRGPVLPEAVALRYERDDPAAAIPRVVARGQGEVAERILATARRHGVAVREDPELLQLLAASRVGEEIPDELFAAVADVLVWLYRTQRGAEDPASG